MSTSNGPGPSDGQEAITDLLREVCGLADEAAERITDSVVNARLNSVLRRAGCTSDAEHEASPAEILAVARREADETLAAAEAARREAEQATAQAELYSDAALRKAASIVAEARIEASRIVEEAQAEAGRIAGDGVRQHASARPASPACGNGVRDDNQQLRDVQDLIAKLDDVSKKLAFPVRAMQMTRSAEAEPADVTPPLPEGAASRVAS